MIKKLILLTGLSLTYIKSFTQDTVLGKATYYAQKFVGRKTATGAIFSHQKMTAASNTFKLGTWLRVVNLFNGKSVDILVNDRMAIKSERKGRVVDLTLRAFEMLDYRNKSILNVKVFQL